MTYCIHMHVLCLYHIYNLDTMAKPDVTNSWLGIYLIYHLHKPGTDEELVSGNFRGCRNSKEPSMDKPLQLTGRVRWPFLPALPLSPQ